MGLPENGSVEVSFGVVRLKVFFSFLGDGSSLFTDRAIPTSYLALSPLEPG